MGWECPRCHACYGPSVAQCFNCTGKTGTAGGTIAWPPSPYPNTSGGTAAWPADKPVPLPYLTTTTTVPEGVAGMLELQANAWDGPIAIYGTRAS